MSSTAQAMEPLGAVSGGKRSQKVLITFNLLLVLPLSLSLDFFSLKIYCFKYLESHESPVALLKTK